MTKVIELRLELLKFDSEVCVAYNLTHVNYTSLGVIRCDKVVEPAEGATQSCPGGC